MFRLIKNRKDTYVDFCFVTEIHVDFVNGNFSTILEIMRKEDDVSLLNYKFKSNLNLAKYFRYIQAAIVA